MTTPIAYATVGIDGDITMLWLPEQLNEARTYCAEGEEPIALGRLMKPLTVRQCSLLELSVEQVRRVERAHGIKP